MSSLHVVIKKSLEGFVLSGGLSILIIIPMYHELFPNMGVLIIWARNYNASLS